MTPEPATDSGNREASPASERDRRRRGIDAEAILTAYPSPAPRGAPALEAALRARIAGALYLGTLRAGDRLPSIRELARHTGVDHRVIQQVYRSLQRTGAVEVRGRAGTYVGRGWARKSADARRLSEAETFSKLKPQQGGARSGPEARTRRKAVQCACVESTEDDRIGLSYELEQRFSLSSILLSPGSDEMSRLRDADFILTTPFHVAEVHRQAPPDIPIFVTSPESGIRDAIDSHPAEGSLWVVCLDAACTARLRHSLGRSLSRCAGLTTLETITRSGEIHTEPVILTPAAWLRLGGGDPPANFTIPEYLPAELVRQVTELLPALRS